MPQWKRNEEDQVELVWVRACLLDIPVWDTPTVALQPVALLKTYLNTLFVEVYSIITGFIASFGPRYGSFNS